MNTEKGTLLIVDDIPTNLKVLFSYLKGLDFKVRVARDGEDALAQVAYAQPDLIILDVMMPKMDGFEACRRLKADEKTRHIPIIFMTAKSETVDKVKGFELGAVDYVTKPIQQEEVIARITAHLLIRNQHKLLQQKNSEIESKNAELQQQNDELEAFAHTVAHDLKNPVNVISGYSELLIEDLSSTIDTASLEMLQKTHRAGQNIVNIIDALLLLASARQQVVEMTPLNMIDIVTNVQHRLDLMIEEYQGEIILSSEWPTALGYAPWIEEVWTNYISNGLKYGGRPPRLELGTTQQENGQIRFWVRDNGQGISSEEQDKLFVPFTRISQARVEGHGLGLSIVQRVVSKCGGEVGVESQIGQGSTFYFTLSANP
jgi:two-component system sensor histidine kinase/response regulator